MGDLGVQVSVHLFIRVLTSTQASTVATMLNEVNFTSLITELNKDDNSYSSGACFYILVCRWDINFNEVLPIFGTHSVNHFIFNKFGTLLKY